MIIAVKIIPTPPRRGEIIAVRVVRCGAFVSLSQRQEKVRYRKYRYRLLPYLRFGYGNDGSKHRNRYPILPDDTDIECECQLRGTTFQHTGCQCSGDSVRHASHYRSAVRQSHATPSTQWFINCRRWIFNTFVKTTFRRFQSKRMDSVESYLGRVRSFIEVDPARSRI